jgi:hypothetical protein
MSALEQAISIGQQTKADFGEDQASEWLGLLWG